MREQIDAYVRKLCWLYPQLKPVVRWSQMLSQDEVSVFAAFAAGHVDKLVNEYRDEKVAELLRGVIGMSAIEPHEVEYVKSLVSAAKGSSDGMAPHVRAVVKFLQENPNVLEKLSSVCSKIEENALVGSVPLASRHLGVSKIVFGALNEFEETHRLVHEAIHFLIENAGIKIDDEQSREGLVVFLHEQVAPFVRHVHYVGDEGERYVSFADKVKLRLEKYPHGVQLLKVKEWLEEGTIAQ